MIAFKDLDETSRPVLLAASARQFGTGAYQAEDRYLEWLYRRNPASQGLADAVVAVQDGMVVGCMHRLMLPIRGGGRMAALHNHFVDPAVRSGSGVLLLRRATRSVAVAVAPGVEDGLAPIYTRLRFHAVQGAWLGRPLNYGAIATGLIRNRLGIGGHSTVCGEWATDETVVTATPTDRQVADLCAGMREREGEAGVDWSEPLVRWRYFDPQGPRHLLVSARGSPAYAVLAIGRRKGVRTMRVMEFEDHDTPGWAAAVARAGRRAGAALGLAFTTDRATASVLARAGWRPRAGTTHSFATAPLARLSPAATDLGFEAFGTVVL